MDDAGGNLAMALIGYGSVFICLAVWGVHASGRWRAIGAELARRRAARSDNDHDQA